MPLLTMVPRDRCALCGCRLRGFTLGTYRVNKHSLKADRGGLSWLECPECGPSYSRRNPLGALLGCERWRLDAKSQAVVDAIHARKGWAKGDA